MRVFVDLSGTGVGARKQHRLMTKAKPQLFTQEPGLATHVIYFQSFTKDFARLEYFKNRGCKIVCRVGGFHPENAETTWRLLREADGAVFVARWLREYLKTPRLLGKTWRLPKDRTVIPNGSTWIGRRNSPTLYLLIRCAQIGKVHFRRGLNRAHSIWAMGEIWEAVRERYPRLELWILGKYDRETKASYRLPGWKWLGYKSRSRWYGQGALGLVHLVTSDFSPNTVSEALGEGCPVIVPNRGGAFEVAGYGGVHVRYVQTDNRKFPETECGGHFYTLDKDSLFEAVCNVIENAQIRQLAAKDWWTKHCDITLTVRRWEKFLNIL